MKSDNYKKYFGILGIKDEYSRKSKELLAQWLGDEAYMLQSKTFWKNIIENSEKIEKVSMWEIECFT